MLGGPAPGFGMAPAGAPAAIVGPREITFLNLSCRALNQKRFSASGNREFVECLQTNFQAATNYFLAEGTTLTNRVEEVELTNHTFGFSVTLQLKEPIRF